MARAKGLRRLAVAQLGSRDALDENEFAKRCAKLAIKTVVPIALREAAKKQNNTKKRQPLIDCAEACETAAAAAAEAADAAAGQAASAASDADGDKILSDFAEGVVQILIKMNAPGCKWLALTEAA
jgi:creatinine amidohydrolase/Fe(II)-dependent formamide hydrolase-like protein